MSSTITSAAGILALLQDSSDLKVFALNKLNEIVDLFWAEISEDLSLIEVLYEDSKFSHQDLAALVTSKVYYHLGEFDDSLTYALGAGKLFNVEENSVYVQTIISKAIDNYISLRQQQFNNTSEKIEIDAKLETIVQRMFERSYINKEFKQVIGIALESLRLDVVEDAINKGDKLELLDYVRTTSMNIIENIEFRNKVLTLLVKVYQTLPEPDYISIGQCLTTLQNADEVADLLKNLIKKDAHHIAVAYQVSFDIEANATQDFIQRVLEYIPKVNKGLEMKDEDKKELENSEDKPLLKDDSLDKNTVNESDPLASIYEKLRNILTGKASIKFYLDFLVKNNHSDLAILKQTKDKFESRNSVHHSGLSFANAFMSAGTTSDDFLRQNLDWLRRASNWSKFSATAGFGVIHKGQLDQGRALLDPYLPKTGVTGSSYSEGGALFALGLIHTNHGSGVLEYLSNTLANTSSDVVQHGACLGLGVAGMASASQELYNELKQILFSDSAVAGEAASIAIGLVMLGTGNKEVIDEILGYTLDTQHEKIIRGCAIGIALINFGLAEQSDELIDRLLANKDPILRYGGIYTVAMAYAGSGNNKAIERLLNIAVSDVNDDVRRAAVSSLGFVLFRNPKQVPRVVELLSESFNPHVRYGSALALGISCAGTGSKEALEILDPMLNDTVDYVRQGALIAYAMILVQHNEVQSPKVTTIRKQFEKIIGDKHEDLMAQFGAVLGQGIIDAGGRNVTIGLISRSGSTNMSAVVGMLLFTQFWYWYPLAHFLSLSFTPTAIIGIDNELKPIELGFEVLSNSKPSLFAYPPPIKQHVEEKVEKVATAVLSTTNKAIARAKKQKKSEGMDIEDTEKLEKENEEEKKKSEEDETKVEEEEEKYEILGNGTRVTPLQLEHITISETSEYIPVKKNLGGIMVLEHK